MGKFYEFVNLLRSNTENKTCVSASFYFCGGGGGGEKIGLGFLGTTLFSGFVVLSLQTTSLFQSMETSLKAKDVFLSAIGC